MATVFSRDAWRCVWHMIQVKQVNLNFLPITPPLLKGVKSEACSIVE